MASTAISPFYHTSPSSPSLARKLFDSVGMDYQPHRTRSESIAHHGAHSLRQGGEAILVGGLAGALHAMGALDVKMGTHELPLDFIGGVALFAAAVHQSHEEHATDLRNAGASLLTVSAFRHIDAIVGTQRLSKGEMRGATKSLAVHGDDVFGLDAGKDPIVAFAEQL